MCSFQERNVSSLSIWGNVYTLQTAYRNFLILCQIVSHANINLLLHKQDTKNWSENAETMAGIAILRHVFSLTQTELYSQINRLINTSTEVNCIYSLPCFCSDSNDMQNKFSCLNAH